MRATPSSASPRLSPPPCRAARRTYGGLLAAGLKYAAVSTLRTGVWFAATAALSATLKESFRVGPRYQSGPAAVQAPVVLLANAFSGAAVAYGLMLDWQMSPARRGLYAAFGGVGGIALPLFVGVFGPAVRMRLARILPQSLQAQEPKGGGGGGAGGALA